MMVAIPAHREPNLAALLSEMADLAYFRVDDDQNVVEISPAMERLTGFSAEEVVGRSCLCLHRCDECLQGCGVFDEGVVRDKVLRLYRADGSQVEVAKSGRVLFDAEGSLIGAIEIVRPVDGGRQDDTSASAVEARRIRDALERHRYNRTAAARSLGISRTSLWRKMREYGI